MSHIIASAIVVSLSLSLSPRVPATSCCQTQKSGKYIIIYSTHDRDCEIITYYFYDYATIYDIQCAFYYYFFYNLLRIYWLYLPGMVVCKHTPIEYQTTLAYRPSISRTSSHKHNNMNIGPQTPLVYKMSLMYASGDYIYKSVLQ